MNENMNRFDYNTEGKICDYGEEEPKVLSEQEILEELNRLAQANYELSSECTSVNWTNECLQEELNKAIVPRFNFNSIVSYISDKTGIVVSDNTIDKIKIVATKERFYSNIKIKYKLTYNTKYFDEDELFATKEEARAKLKEMQNGNTK